MCDIVYFEVIAMDEKCHGNKIMMITIITIIIITIITLTYSMEQSPS